MSLEKIKEEILSKAHSEERAILLKAQMQVKDIQSDTGKTVKELEKENSKKLKEELKTIEQRETAVAESEAQKILYAARKEVIDDTYAKAYEKVLGLSEKDREHVIKKLLKKAEGEIKVDHVCCNTKDKKHLKKTTKSLHTDGGIIGQTKDGSVQVDYTFPTLFSEVQEKTLHQTTQTLFN